MSTSNPAISSKLIGTEGLALLIGAILTPVAVGLSLQLLPVVPALLIYALIAGIIAFRNPDQSWEWGLWAFGGMIVALMLAILIIGGVAIWSGDQIDALSIWGMFEATSVFGLLPALVGGCLGGILGSYLSNRAEN